MNETGKKAGHCLHTAGVTGSIPVASTIPRIRSTRRVLTALLTAEHCSRRKASPFRSAMPMLTFYINRAEKNLPDDRRTTIEAAKQMLPRDFGRAEK